MIQFINSRNCPQSFIEKLICTLLGAGNRTVNKTEQNLCLLRAHILLAYTDNKKEKVIKTYSRLESDKGKGKTEGKGTETNPGVIKEQNEGRVVEAEQRAAWLVCG